MGISINNLSSAYNTSTLFNSLPEAKSGAMENLTNTLLGNTSAISLTDYASIKNGSYKSLLKAYYAGDNTAKAQEKASREAIRSDYSSTVEDTTAEDTPALTQSAKSLNSAAETLMSTDSDSPFRQKTGYGADEGDMINYDQDKLVSAVKDFADSYNSVLSNASGSNNDKITQSVSDLTAAAKNNSDALARVGIQVGSDGQLSVDENKLKTADVSRLKSLFNEAGSFGAQAGSYASQIGYYSGQEDSGVKSGYSANGAYASASSLADSLYSSYI